MHVNREHGYGKRAVGFLIGYGLLPFWASSVFVFIGGIYSNGDWWGVAPWLIIFSIPICGGTLFIAGAIIKVHANADGDPFRKKAVATIWFLALNALLVGLLYLMIRLPK
jgi:hypothetical protein